MLIKVLVRGSFYIFCHCRTGKGHFYRFSVLPVPAWDAVSLPEELMPQPCLHLRAAHHGFPDMPGLSGVASVFEPEAVQEHWGHPARVSGVHILFRA